MARKNILTSDLTQQEITAPAYIRLVVGADEWQLDVDAAEEIVATLQAAGSKKKRRGRKAKTTA